MIDFTANPLVFIQGATSGKGKLAGEITFIAKSHQRRLVVGVSLRHQNGTLDTVKCYRLAEIEHAGGFKEKPNYKLMTPSELDGKMGLFLATCDPGGVCSTTLTRQTEAPSECVTRGKKRPASQADTDTARKQNQDKTDDDDEHENAALVLAHACVSVVCKRKFKTSRGLKAQKEV